MERKLGEIFEYNGEWYQCVGGTCRNCIFYDDTVCKNITTIGSTNFGNCHCSLRTDHKSVIFKKLEKVGEPYFFVDKIVQNYLLETEMSALPEDIFILTNNKLRLIAIEIKQNKEDMEENNNAKHSNSGNLGKNLKPFNLEAAKAGKPVCTRDGRKARIICFDKDDKDNMPIVALVYQKDNQESVCIYYEDGRQSHFGKTKNDLMMLPEKKEGWVNLYKSLAYSTKEGAMKYRNKGNDYIDTIKISWEE